MSTIYFYGSTKQSNGTFKSIVRECIPGEPVAPIVSMSVHPSRGKAYRYARHMAETFAKHHKGSFQAF